jgi:hypothetical protein
MKKKLLSLALLAVMFFTFVSCDILSTILAAKGFYEEYTEYSAVYENATQLTVETEIDLTISETTVVETLEEIHSRVYVMLDKESDFLYVEQELFEVAKTSVYEDAEDIYVEYVITEGDVVTPTQPAEEDRFDSNVNSNIMNENFSYDSVENENIVEGQEHTYSFDVSLNQAINLDELGDFVDQLALFGGDASSFDDAIANVVISFTSADSVIDITATVLDYTITFEDETYVTLTLENHTILSVPETFEMPNVFAAPYQYVAVDNALLARRAYTVDEVIDYPVVNGANGYVMLDLPAGTYELNSVNEASFTYSITDSEGTMIDMTSGELMVLEDAVYYLYIMPTADFQSDLVIEGVTVMEVVVTTEVTTEG